MRLFEGQGEIIRGKGKIIPGKEERLFYGRDYSMEENFFLWKRDYFSKGKDYSRRREYQVVSYFSFKIIL